MPLEIRDTVTSTMDVARDNLLSGRVACDAAGRFSCEGVLAAYQTVGRGQRQRVWHAPPGESLCATYYFQHGFASPHRAGQVALLAGVAVAEALDILFPHPVSSSKTFRGEQAMSPSPEGHGLDFVSPVNRADSIGTQPQEGRTQQARAGQALPLPPQPFGEAARFTGLTKSSPCHSWSGDKPQNSEKGARGMRADEETVSVGLKWPNDLLLNDKKVGGVLIEMVTLPNGEWVALIGVGINVHVRVFPPELAATATSLALEGVTPGDVQDLGERIAASLHAQADLLRAEGFAALLERWRTFDRTSGRHYQAEMEGETARGVAVGVDDTGALCLRLDDGRIVSVLSASTVLEL